MDAREAAGGNLGFRASAIVLSGMSAPRHEVVGGRRINEIEQKKQDGELKKRALTQFSHPRRSAVTTQIYILLGFSAALAPSIPTYMRCREIGYFLAAVSCLGGA